MMRWFCVLAALLLVAAGGSANAEDEFPRIRFGGLLDARFIDTDKAVSWYDGGLGKLRYGGADGERSELVRLSQASLLVNAALTDVLSAKLQLNVNAEPDRLGYRSAVDLIEGYVSYRPVLSPRVRLRMRGGVFFPPVSLENTGIAWTTPYTLTPSAINTWIGEEVRTAGGEFTFVLSPESQEIALTVAAFGNNDPAGSLLAWRGWTLGDRVTGWNERLPLAWIPAIRPDGLFQRQAPYVQPFREIDGKLGYYFGGSWSHRWFEFNGLYYDNRGQSTDFDGTQYAWYTEFKDVGLDLHLPANIQVISQYMTGYSEMGPANAVYIDFNSAFVLVTVGFGPHRISARYDTFRVKDEDRFPDIDNNTEDGSAWTAAYLLQLGDHCRLGFELLRVESDRDVRASLGWPVHQKELQFQSSIRVSF